MIGALPRTDGSLAQVPELPGQDPRWPGAGVSPRRCTASPARALREPAPASLLARPVSATWPVVPTSVLPFLESLVVELYSTVAF